MENMRILSASGQLAEYLKEQIRTRKWTNTMPGESWMMTELQVGRGTVRAAMAQLEEEGMLEPCGQGKRRRIVMSEDIFATRKIRVRIFAYERNDRKRIDCSSLLAQLLEAGMDAEFTGKSLKELGMQVDRVARYVSRNPADAWVVMCASQEILEWFAGQATPTIAMFGRHEKLPIAAAYPIMITGLTAAVQRFIELGHKRIVMLAREERRKPQLSHPEQLFIDQLKAAGITTGDYNLPDWEESREGLGRLVDKLLRVSPPTALIFQEAQLYIAVKSLLAYRGIVSPRDISLVVADDDPSFGWCSPVPSHIRWDYRQVVRRVVRWAKNVAAGKDDRRKTGTEAEFVEGGTIGPASAAKPFPG
jgi:DNA-binding transcriptional regulator YhcF (GntR family)